MKTRRIKATVSSISISFNEIKLSLSSINYTCFVDAMDIEWFSIDKNNRSIQHILELGCAIYFELPNLKTRRLENVKFIE